VPHTPATQGFMGRARFQRMKRSAFFINIGRGLTTRLDDLVAALRAGEIAGAALDVFEEEPLPSESPLWDMENVLVSPHISGDVEGWEADFASVFYHNLERWLRGESLRNVVDKRLGYPAGDQLLP